MSVGSVGALERCVNDSEYENSPSSQSVSPSSPSGEHTNQFLSSRKAPTRSKELNPRMSPACTIYKRAAMHQRSSVQVIDWPSATQPGSAGFALCLALVVVVVVKE